VITGSQRVRGAQSLGVCCEAASCRGNQLCRSEPQWSQVSSSELQHPLSVTFCPLLIAPLCAHFRCVLWLQALMNASICHWWLHACVSSEHGLECYGEWFSILHAAILGAIAKRQDRDSCPFQRTLPTMHCAPLACHCAWPCSRYCASLFTCEHGSTHILDRLIVSQP
jgi:hypothetical protein